MSKRQVVKIGSGKSSDRIRDHAGTGANRLSMVWLNCARQGCSALLPFGFHLDSAR
jgi:hypothetical protein